MADNLAENLARITQSLTDDCLRAVCFHLDRLEDIKSFSNVCQRFRQAALYRLSRMSLAFAVDTGGCNCKDRKEVHEDSEWTCAVQDAHNSVSVTHPLTIQHNEALVQGIHRIKLYQSICPTENEEQFVTLRETLNQFTAVTQFCWCNYTLHWLDTALAVDIHLRESSHLCCALTMLQNTSALRLLSQHIYTATLLLVHYMATTYIAHAIPLQSQIATMCRYFYTFLGEENDGDRDRSQACVGRSPAAVLFDLCEPFFQQLLGFEIPSVPSSLFEFVGSDLELLCNMLCAMPKLVDVSIAPGISCDSFIKLSQILHGKGTSALNVVSAFRKIKLTRHLHTCGDLQDGDGASVTDIVAAVSEYPNLVELDIDDTGCPAPNNRVDLMPLQNLTKLKSFSAMLGRCKTDLGLYVIPSQLTVVNLGLVLLECIRFSVVAQLLKACQSLSVIKIAVSQPFLVHCYNKVRLGSCTFAEFLTNFEMHTHLTELMLGCSGRGSPFCGLTWFPDEHEHFRSHFLELTLRAPTCLKHLQFSLSPHVDWTAEDEMQHWASVVKIARTQTLHITFGFNFEDSLVEQLTTAMQHSVVKELLVDVQFDTLERAADGRKPHHYASVITGTRPGNDLPFRIEFIPTLLN